MSDDQWSRDEVRRRTVSALRSMLRRQHTGARRRRIGPEAVQRVLFDVKAQGVDLLTMRGPWRTSDAPIVRLRGRGSKSVPCVERGRTSLFATTEQHAQELAGLLNWCEIEETDLVERTGPHATEEVEPTTER
ncbi:MAG: hypothetical protein ACTHQQ_14225 [Solirubrobacteraceae bacterium]